MSEQSGPLSPPDYAGRLKRASGAVDEANLGAMVVTPSADLVYLTGYGPLPLERLTCLVIRPFAEPVLVVPELERPLAEMSMDADLVEMRSWDETEDPYALVAALAPRGPVACSDRMWAAHLLGLQTRLAVTFEPASSVLGRLRAVKERGEIDRLRRAALGADAAFAAMLGDSVTGCAERDVAERLGGLLRDNGHDEVTFTIVGSGPNGASPHHEPGERVIQPGDAVVLDFGGRADGYCSDITRTVVIGDAPEGFEEAYRVVHEAQEAAFARVGPGVLAEDVDRAAREVIDKAGLGDAFIHRTGHGIGLDEHERPYIVAGNEEELRPGMCFSIEPGVYLPGRFGVRIEDIVTVTEDGAERLNTASRELHTLS